MTWTVVDFDNNLCLVLVPYLSFTFPKHGLHIREYTDTHSPEAAARIHDDAAASQCLRSASCIPPRGCILYEWTTTDISQDAVAAATREYAAQTPRSAPITQRLKTKTERKIKKILSTQYQSR